MNLSTAGSLVNAGGPGSGRHKGLGTPEKWAKPTYRPLDRNQPPEPTKWAKPKGAGDDSLHPRILPKRSYPNGREPEFGTAKNHDVLHEMHRALTSQGFKYTSSYNHDKQTTAHRYEGTGRSGFIYEHNKGTHSMKIR